MNDVHLNIEQTEYEIPMAGEVCNIKLYQTMLDQAAVKVQESGEPLTAIFIPGDYNEHSLPKDDWDTDPYTPNDNWGQMKKTFQTVTQLAAEKFPGIPVLPAIGNNDCYYHDQSPLVEYDGIQTAEEYYSELQTIFFDEVPGNAALSQDADF